MIVPFLNLSVTDKELQEGYCQDLVRVMNHGRFVMGSEVESFEELICSHVGSRNAISVSSGTDAVYLAIRSLDLPIGSEIIMPCLSWIATANAVAMAGHVPVFCDIGEDLNIEPSKIEELISEKTGAILTVDYTGNMCDYTKIAHIGNTFNIPIVQDASQAFGASYKNQLAGRQGVTSAISHNPMKIYGGLGEAGTVFTDSDEVAERVRILRYNGTINKEVLSAPSLNFRLDALQAAFLKTRLKYFAGESACRTKIADYYNKAITATIKKPKTTPNSDRVYYCYTILVEDRDEVVRYLSDKGIETKVQHPILMSSQSPYKSYKNNVSVGERVVKQILSLPIYPSMPEEHTHYIVDCVNSFYR